ncbi:type II secretion system ATPase GspE [Marinobacterium stanieri]|uniref:Type II secretion system protein E n=1 Tax=Marinobacterium stanieri TaxID=49186 RepID=A0A1N6XJA9_9GAMM|nr:type II secretion system ATPase GspE [Marinobacterium stanieri]SIR02380.1 type II secretion system protein E (GspE) [Marinobacterium stanieri]
MSEAIDFNDVDGSAELPLKRQLPFSFANKYRVLVEDKHDGQPLCLITDQTPLAAILEVRRYLNIELPLEQVSSEHLEQRLGQHYQQSSQANIQLMEQLGEEADLFKLIEELPESEDLLAAEGDAPIIRLINALLSEAIKEEASDIHIEPYDKCLSVRLRVDGVLREILSPNYKLAPLLISRIKVMAKLDIAEKRVPQDGRTALRIAGRALDVRVSTLPSSYGERVVMRLLDKRTARLSLGDLGMPIDIYRHFKQLLLQPNGIILVTGPTGSGKTTSLYAGIGLLNERSRNILTVEDPIEYAIDGVGQTQVNQRAGMTFAKGLRAMLRQDPDVLMIGEIRDLETAEVAIQASLTGHLVLSTLHTNSAAGAITRLRDIGLDAYLVASSLKGVMAQRLVRRLCHHCRELGVISNDEAALLNAPSLEGESCFHSRGCKQCNGTGYRGRVGVYELVMMDGRLAELINQQAGEVQVRQYLSGRMRSLMDEAHPMIQQGITSVAEVLRTIHTESL